MTEQITPGSVYVKLTRPEGYEDVAPELVLEDAGMHPAFSPEDVTAEIERLRAQVAPAVALLADVLDELLDGADPFLPLTRKAADALAAYRAAPAQQAEPTPDFLAGTFIQHVQNVAGVPGHWPDEFLAWYKPADWLTEERAVAVFLGQKLAAPSLTVGEGPAASVIATAPKRIWLNVFDAPENTDGDKLFPSDHEGITWAEDEVGDYDVQYIRADLVQPAAQAEPVAWCELTPAGKIAYFDGRPMVMPGPVGNDCHTTPLYAHHPAQGVGGERSAFETWITETLNYGYDLERDAGLGEGYTHDATDTAWLAWQARAALAQAPAAEPTDADVDKAWHRFEAELQRGAEARDAMRYRFLRDADRSDPAIDFELLLSLAMDSLDDAVDAAMAAEKP
jgi:hypothetical protein